MEKRDYDKEYQARKTRVIQVRLHIDKDDDILCRLDQEKAWGRSYARTIKDYFRLGLRYEFTDPSHITDEDKQNFENWRKSLND